MSTRRVCQRWLACCVFAFLCILWLIADFSRADFVPLTPLNNALNTDFNIDDSFAQRNDVRPRIATNGNGTIVAVWLRCENSFFTVGSNNTMYWATSSDYGAGWTSPIPFPLYTPLPNGLESHNYSGDVIFNRDRFIAAWPSRFVNASASITNLHVFVFSSFDGLNWTEAPSPPPEILLDTTEYLHLVGDGVDTVMLITGQYLVLFNASFSYDNGVTWSNLSEVAGPNGGSIDYDLGYGNGRFILAFDHGYAPSILSSNVFLLSNNSWLGYQDISQKSCCAQVVYHNGLFVIAFESSGLLNTTVSAHIDDATLMTSTDGVVWSSPVGINPVDALAPTPNYIHDWDPFLVYTAQGWYVVFVRASDVWQMLSYSTSTDLTNWTSPRDFLPFGTQGTSGIGIGFPRAVFDGRSAVVVSYDLTYNFVRGVQVDNDVYFSVFGDSLCYQNLTIGAPPNCPPPSPSTQCAFGDSSGLFSCVNGTWVAGSIVIIANTTISVPNAIASSLTIEGHQLVISALNLSVANDVIVGSTVGSSLVVASNGSVTISGNLTLGQDLELQSLAGSSPSLVVSGCIELGGSLKLTVPYFSSNVPIVIASGTSCVAGQFSQIRIYSKDISCAKPTNVRTEVQGFQLVVLYDLSNDLCLQTFAMHQSLSALGIFRLLSYSFLSTVMNYVLR